MRKNRCIFMFFFIFTSGCASFSPEEMSSLDHGPYPDNHKEIVQQYLNARLKDPASAIIEYRADPRKVWQNGSIVSSKEYGWGVCLWINAKNSYGGYVGRRPYAFIIRNGTIIQAHGTMETNMFDTALAQGLCKQLGAS